MTVINTNTASMNAQFNLNKVNQQMEKAMEQLSSGKRINSASDDAAGLAIATRMESQVRGLNQAIRNASDSLSLASTAEGAMDEVSNILQRMGELAIQASNGAMNPSDRQSLQDEMDVLTDEIDRIADTTRFNNIKLLDGSFDDTFQIGQTAGETVGLSIGDMSSTAFGVGAFADNAIAIETSRGNVAGNSSIAQIDKLTISGTAGSGDTFDVSVDDYSFTYTVTGSEGGIGGIRDAIVQRVNNTSGMKNIVSSSGGTNAGEILLTSKTAGEAFSASAVSKNVASINSVATTIGTVQQNVAGKTAAAQVDQVNIAGTIEVGDTYTLTVDGQTVNYTVGTSDTDVGDIVTGVLSEIGKNAYLGSRFTAAAFTPTGGSAVTGLTLTANTAGTAFSTAISSSNRVNAAVTSTQTTSVANAKPEAEDHVLDFSNVGPIEQDDKFAITIGNETYSYTSNTGDTVKDVRDDIHTKIAAAITGGKHNNLTATTVGANSIKLQASGTAEFTVTAKSTASAGTTSDNTATVGTKTQSAQLATVGLSELVVANTSIKAGEALSFSVDIDGTAVTTAADYTVTANDVIDQTAFRNRLVAYLNNDANMKGATTSPVFSAGKDASSIDITAGGTGKSVHVDAGSVKSDTVQNSTATFITDTSTLVAGDTITLNLTVGTTATTSAAYTVLAADKGATSGATFVTNLAAHLNADAKYNTDVKFTANGLVLEMETLAGGTANAVDTTTAAAFTIASTTGGTAGTLAAPTLAETTAATDNSATANSSFAVRTAPLENLNQIQTVTITGTPEKGDIYTFGHGATKFEYTVLGSEGPKLEHLRNAITTAMNADAAFKLVMTASNGGGSGDIILTSSGNTAATITASATDRGSNANTDAAIVKTNYVKAVAQEEKFALTGNVEEGDKYGITVDGTTLTYVATAADVSGGMRALTDSIIAEVNKSGGVLVAKVEAERSTVASEFIIKSATDGTAIVASLGITNRTADAQTTSVLNTTENSSKVTAVAQKDTVKLAEPGGSGFSAGLTFDLTSSDGTTAFTFRHTTTAGQTSAQVMSALVAGFNAISSPSAAVMTASIDPSDTGKIIMTADAAGTAITTSITDGTATATALGSDITSFQSNQGGISAVAQQQIIKLSGTLEAQDTYTLNVNGNEVSFTTTGMEKTMDQVAATLADLVNENANISSKVLAEVAGDGSLRITSKTGGEAFTVEASASNGKGGSLASMNVLDQKGATNAMKIISSSLERVNNQRSALGAFENRLDHTVSNLGNVVINTEASQSRIQDADFAKVTGDLTKSQIMSQAATAMLAQANASKQGVLSLLQG